MGPGTEDVTRLTAGACMAPSVVGSVKTDERSSAVDVSPAPEQSGQADAYCERLPEPSDTPAKIVTFLFAAVIYGLVWITLVYIVCFVGNFFSLLVGTRWEQVVPLKSIDTGKSSSFSSALTINLILILILGLQHSVMARPGFKALVTKVVAVHAERGVFIVFAIGALSLLMWQWRPMKQPIWDIGQPAVWALLTGIQVCGWATVLWATFQVGHWKIFGVTQALDYICDKPYTRMTCSRLPNEFFETGWPITEKGVWKYARHPDFFGFCVAFWATPTMSVGHLVFALGLTTYIMFGIFFLERNLSQLYGIRYEEYVRTRSRIIPWFVKQQQLSPRREVPEMVRLARTVARPSE